MSQELYTKSSAREKLIEHLFIGEVLSKLWKLGYHDVDVLRPEVDSGGFDLVIECSGFIRHIQLKSSTRRSKTGSVSLNIRLAEKPSGCAIWIWFDEDTLELGPFGWFGGSPGEPLPDLAGFRIGKRTTARKTDGVKPERLSQKVIPKGQFEPLQLNEIIVKLFGVGG